MIRAKEKSEKKFDSVQLMRDIRNRIDKETERMNFQQLKDYYRKSTEANNRQKGR